VDIAPVWRTPHHFSRLPVDGDAHSVGLQPVFTYALLATELGETDLSKGLPPDAVSRVGYEWLASLADRLRGDWPRTKSAMTAFLQDEVGIAKPGQDSNKALLGGQHGTILPADQLEAFTETELPRIREFVDLELRPFLPELNRAADNRHPPDPGSVVHPEGDGLAAALRLMTVYGPQLEPVPLHDPVATRTIWGLAFRNLAERIAVELFEIFATQQRLHRCRFCKRIFVPRTRTDSKCRADLWALGQPSPLEFCIPQHAVDSHNAGVVAGQHERERKRRHQQMRREAQRYGENSARAKRAKADYETWLRQHGKQRGPAPHPRPDLHKHTGDM
jgi:hypothetical protein